MAQSTDLSLSDHLRNTLDGRWRDTKNRMREQLSNEIFKPHYTPNTVIARTELGRPERVVAGGVAGGNGGVAQAAAQDHVRVSFRGGCSRRPQDPQVHGNRP